jgi:3-hydroxyacyl-CoA dehydrogenase
MTNAKPIRRIAIFGTGVIGASWTALFLARGLHVTGGAARARLDRPAGVRPN